MPHTFGAAEKMTAILLFRAALDDMSTRIIFERHSPEMMLH